MNNAANTPDGMVLITAEQDAEFTQTVRELLAVKRTNRELKAQAVKLEQDEAQRRVESEQHEAQRRIARRAWRECAEEQIAEKNTEIASLKAQLKELKEMLRN